MSSSNAPFLEQAAIVDAARILQDTQPLHPFEPVPAVPPPAQPPTTASTTASIDLESIGDGEFFQAYASADASSVSRLMRTVIAEARKLVSEEHRALGYRPPEGSLAAQAQSAAAQHPEGSLFPPNEKALTEAAEADAVRVT